MERCKGDFYVSLVRNLRFSRPSCTFSAWETYGSASGNVECGSRFVSLCRWILLFLCGDVSFYVDPEWGKTEKYKNKKASTIIRLSMLFTSRGDWIRTSDHTPPRAIHLFHIFLYLIVFQYICQRIRNGSIGIIYI